MRTIPILITLALLLAACGTTSDDGPRTGDDAETSGFSLLLTDAPTDDAEWLSVDFGRIELVPNAEAETSGEGIVVVSEEAGTIDNLLELDNGETHALASGVDVPDGTYEQIRLIVEDVTIGFPDGEGGTIEREVKCPSCSESGLKIDVEPALVVEGGESSRIVLDFDAAKAVHLAGKSGKYILRPTAIRAVSVSGVLEGTVEGAAGASVENATVAVYEGARDEGEEPVVSARTDAVGSFRIITLVEGDYTVVVSADGHGATTVETVTISANETTTLEPVVLTEIATGALEGVAVKEGADGSTSFAGASVSVYDGAIETDEDPVAHALTGADGTFTFGALAEGSYTVVIAAEGYEAATIADVTIVPDETTVLPEAVLAAVGATGTIEGTFTSAEASFLGTIEVRVYEGAYEEGELVVDEVVTDAETGFVIDTLAAGEYTVVVGVDGTEAEFEVVVSADATTPVEVDLDAIVEEGAPVDEAA